MNKQQSKRSGRVAQKDVASIQRKSLENPRDKRGDITSQSQVLANLQTKSLEHTLRIPASKISFNVAGKAHKRNELSQSIPASSDQKGFPQQMNASCSSLTGQAVIKRLHQVQQQSKNGPSRTLHLAHPHFLSGKVQYMTTSDQKTSFFGSGQASTQDAIELDQKINGSELKVSSLLNRTESKNRSGFDSSGVVHRPGIQLVDQESEKPHDSSSLIFSNPDKILDAKTSKAVNQTRTETKKKETGPVESAMGEAPKTTSQRSILPQAHSSSRKRLTRNFTFQRQGQGQQQDKNVSFGDVHKLKESELDLKQEVGPVSSARKNEHSPMIKQKSDQSVPSEIDTTPKRSRHQASSQAILVTPEAKKTQVMYPPVRQPEKGVTHRFNEGNCEELLVEDYSDSDLASPTSSKSAMQRSQSLIMQTDKHVEQEIQRSRHRHEIFKVVVPNCTPADKGPKRRHGNSSSRSRPYTISMQSSLCDSLGSYQCKYNIPEACSLSLQSGDCQSPQRASRFSSNTLIEFQNAHDASTNDNNILIMSCTGDEEDADENVKDLASLMSKSKRFHQNTMKNSHARQDEKLQIPASAFDENTKSSTCARVTELRAAKHNNKMTETRNASQHLQLAQPLSMKSAELILPTNKIKFVKTRRQKPVAPQMDTVIQENSEVKAVKAVKDPNLYQTMQVKPGRILLKQARQQVVQLAATEAVSKTGRHANEESRMAKGEKLVFEIKEGPQNKTPGNKRASCRIRKSAEKITIPESKGPRLSMETLSRFIKCEVPAANQVQSKLFKIMPCKVTKAGLKKQQIRSKSGQKLFPLDSESTSQRKEHQALQDYEKTTPKKEQNLPTNSSSVDPVNEYLFLTPEVQGDTSFLKKIHMENLTQGKSESHAVQFKMPLSSPPKKNRNSKRINKVTASNVYSSCESFLNDSWPIIRPATLTSDSTASPESSSLRFKYAAASPDHQRQVSGGVVAQKESFQTPSCHQLTNFTSTCSSGAPDGAKKKNYKLLHLSYSTSSTAKQPRNGTVPAAPFSSAK